MFLRWCINAGLLLCSFLLSCSDTTGQTVDRLPYYIDSQFMPYWIDKQGESDFPAHRVAYSPLINQFGDTIDGDELSGKMAVVNFIHISCTGICCRLSENMAAIQDSLLNEKDVLLLSYVVDPEMATPAVLATYASHFGARPQRWHFLRGARLAIYRLAQDSYLLKTEEPIVSNSTAFLHTERLFLVDPYRRIRGIYNGVLARDVKRLVGDIKLLKAELENEIP